MIIKKNSSIKNMYFIILALFAMLAVPSEVLAKVYLDINAPSTRKMPVAVQVPVPLNNQEPVPLLAREIRDVLAGDLSFSGVFRVLDPILYMEDL